MNPQADQMNSPCCLSHVADENGSWWLEKSRMANAVLHQSAASHCEPRSHLQLKGSIATEIQVQYPPGMRPRPRRPGAAVAPDDATLALLFQRVGHRGAGQRWSSSSKVSYVLEQPSLQGSSEASGSINKEETSRRTLAITTKHALAQEVRETELTLHQGSSASSSNRPVNEPQNLDDQQQQDDAERPVCRIPALQDLEELMNELYEVYDRSQHGDGNGPHQQAEDPEEDPEQELSIQELQYAHTLQRAVVMTLTQAALAKYSSTNTPSNSSIKKDQDPLPLGEVRVWLLEMVVRPCALSRQLAFTLFLNLSISIASILLTTPAVPANDSMRSHSQTNEQMQTRLFHVLIEMLSKAVVVAGSSLKDAKSDTSKAKSNYKSSSREYAWIAQAVGCLLLFTKQGGRYRSDRLNALDPQIIRFFLKEISKSHAVRSDNSSGGGELENQLVELLVFAMYAQEGDIVASNDERIQAQFALPMMALEHFGGLDLLLFYFYNAHSLSTKKLLLLVFFDVTCHHHHHQQHQKVSGNQAKDNEAHDELWRHFQEWDLAFHLASMPSLFTALSSTRVVKKLYASASPELTRLLSEKQVQQFANQLRILIHIDEYFTQSSSLGNTIQLLHDQEKHNVTEVLLGKITQLLGSSRVEDKFQAERWLAELMTYGTSGGSSGLSASSSGNQDQAFLAQHAKDPLSESIIFTGSENDLENSSSDVAPGGALLANQNDNDELEETCCFDEDADIRIAARTKFWELAKSSSPAHRESFARTLSVFVKRKLGAKDSSGLVSIAREINICLRVVVQQQETNQRVLIPLLLLILDVCKCEVSNKDRQKQKYDQKCGEHSGVNQRFVSSASDSLASRFVDGEVALDAALLKEFIPEFFLHALAELQLQSHPRQRCRRKCCGTSSSSPPVDDLITCTALITANIHEGGSSKKMVGPQDIINISALLPLMEACDTRVAVIIAKLVISTLKRRDSEQYMELLCDLHANAVEDDDEAPLTVSYLHATALLARWVH